MTCGAGIVLVVVAIPNVMIRVAPVWMTAMTDLPYNDEPCKACDAGSHHACWVTIIGKTRCPCDCQGYKTRDETNEAALFVVDIEDVGTFTYNLADIGRLARHMAVSGDLRSFTVRVRKANP